jgi:23S rRNA (uridine2552-2'-O)-methyltransferase
LKKNKISKNWVNKQRRDAYVKQSKVDGYRARSAYKLIEIDEKFKIFKGGISVIDIGAAPGSWSQYAIKAAKNGRLISIDLKKMEPIGKTIQIHGDFTDPNIQTEIKKHVNSKVDVVMSDMAVNTTGIKNIDSIQIVAEGKKYFKEVKVFKPKSSRKDSKESFIICSKLR